MRLAEFMAAVADRGADFMKRRPRLGLVAAVLPWAGTLLALVLLLGRCGGPAKVETTREATTDGREVAQLLAQLEERRQEAEHVETTTERRPDGSSLTRTVRDRRAETTATAATSATSAVELRTRERETTTTDRRAAHRLAVMPGWKPSALALAPSEVTAEYTRRLAGPFSAGAFVRVERTPRLDVAAGLVVAVEW